MIKNFIPVAIFFITIVSNAQFTKVQSQPPVTDGQDSGGAAWIDYDNDGDEDLFVVTIATSVGFSPKDLLYRNNGDGTFTSVLGNDLVNEDGQGRNSTWGDYDNDGFIDVFVANQLETSLFKNNGAGAFTKITSLPSLPFSFDQDYSGGTWGDYNNDGFLDLFIGAYKLNDNARNFLFTSNGDGSFAKAPDSNVVTTPGASLDPSWIDFDQNGTLDLFVPTYMTGTNFLYSNLGNSTFAPITSQSITQTVSASMGASWADYDNDGDFDVVIPNNVNASNNFFENNGNGTFSFKVGMFGNTKSTSSSWADFDNDGNIDLMLTGGDGSITTLFKNNGNKTFTDVSVAQGIANGGYAESVVSADYDKDGFVDFFITNGGGGPLINDVLFHNTPNGNHWINIKLVATNTNRSAIGATVQLNTGSKWQARTIQSKTGYWSQNSLRAHFGLGQSTTIDKILVTWPGKGFQVITNQAVDQFVTINEPNFPLVPSNVQASNKELNKMDITWNDNSSNETGFRIERASGSSNFEMLTEVAANVTSFRDNNATANVSYKYRVSALTTGGYSLYSNTYTVFSKKSQQVTSFQPIGEKFLVSDPFQLSATVNSGNQPHFIILDGEEFVSLSGNILDILALGTSVIGAYALDDAQYFRSDTVSQTLVVSLITATEDPSLENFALYPNPTQEEVYVNFKPTRTNPIRFINSAGMVVKSVYQTQEGQPISVKDLPAGLYIISVLNQRSKLLKR